MEVKSETTPYDTIYHYVVQKWRNNRVNNMNTVVTLVDFVISSKEENGNNLHTHYFLNYGFQCLCVSILLQ